MKWKDAVKQAQQKSEIKEVDNSAQFFELAKGTSQIKIFRNKIKEIPSLENEVNSWIGLNPSIHLVNIHLSTIKDDYVFVIAYNI